MSSNPHTIIRTSCPACNHSDTHCLFEAAFDRPPIAQFLHSFYSSRGGIDSHSLDGAHYYLDKCLHCGLVYQREILDSTLMQSLYNKWIDPEIMRKHHEAGFGLDTYVGYAEELMLLIRHLGKRPAETRVLDFGMGWCKWLRMARAFGCSTCGYDVAPSRIAYAQSQGLNTIDLNAISGDSFDIINADQVFEHIPHPLETLKLLSTSLAPHGLIQIGVPSGERIASFLSPSNARVNGDSFNSVLMPVQPLEHINCYSRVSLLALAESCGLAPVTISLKHRLAYRTVRRLVGDIREQFLRPKSFESGLAIIFEHSRRPGS